MWPLPPDLQYVELDVALLSMVEVGCWHLARKFSSHVGCVLMMMPGSAPSETFPESWHAGHMLPCSRLQTLPSLVLPRTCQILRANLGCGLGRLALYLLV